MARVEPCSNYLSREVWGEDSLSTFKVYGSTASLYFNKLVDEGGVLFLRSGDRLNEFFQSGFLSVCLLCSIWWNVEEA